MGNDRVLLASALSLALLSTALMSIALFWE
jgi:hypothetical protein